MWTVYRILPRYIYNLGMMAKNRVSMTGPINRTTSLFIKMVSHTLFWSEDHADYHRPGDTFDKGTKAFTTRFVL